MSMQCVIRYWKRESANHWFELWPTIWVFLAHRNPLAPVWLRGYRMERRLIQLRWRKLIVPTYQALVKTQAGLAFAQEVFAKARPGYHPITIATVENLLAKAKPEH